MSISEDDCVGVNIGSAAVPGVYSEMAAVGFRYSALPFVVTVVVASIIATGIYQYLPLVLPLDDHLPKHEHHVEKIQWLLSLRIGLPSGSKHIVLISLELLLFYFLLLVLVHHPFMYELP